VSKLRKIPATHIFLGFILWSFLFPNLLTAQYQKKPPDFGSSYSLPTPTHPEPTATWLRTMDVALLAAALGLSAWLVHKNRSRKAMIWLSLGSVAYFGFFRKGCICSVGSIQNVLLCLVNPQYAVSFGVIVIFFLPLLVTLLFGRVFCGGVCPLGAIQDLVVVKPLKVPVRLDRALRWLQYIYLGLAIFFAGWGLQLKLGASHIKIGQRFLICEWDPFIAIFRRSGPFYMVALAAAFIVAGMFIGRPYCRWLCPYGGILALFSRVAWKNVRITPDKELDCGKCAEACPYGAIHNLRADRAECLACSRCYDYCPRQKRLVALRAKARNKTLPIAVAAAPRRWEAVVRTWTGVIAMCFIAGSAAVLLATYVRARSVIPTDKALIDTLRIKSKTDAEVQNVLRPELERQHNAAVARRLVYSRGGGVLVLSGALLIFWLSWLRPKHGAGAGVPECILAFLEQPSKQQKK
jgi:polyferredoxin